MACVLLLEVTMQAYGICRHSQTCLAGKQACISDFLSQFDFAVVHMLGKSNVVADALSRRPDLATAVVDTMV